MAAPRRPPPSTAYWPGWDIVRDIAVLPDGTGGYVLDGWGGIHPFAIGATRHRHGIGRLLARLGHRPQHRDHPDGTGGYVLDGWGGIHPFAIGSNPIPSATSAGYWNGWDVWRHDAGSVTHEPA